MRHRPCFAVIVLAFVFASFGAGTALGAAPAQSAPEPAAAPAHDDLVREARLQTEVAALIDRINAKLQQGAATETELADELAAFDDLLTRHADSADQDALAEVAFLRATLYTQVLKDYDRGRALLQEIGVRYPRSETAAALPRLLAGIEAQAEAARTVAALIGRPAPPLHFEWASREGLHTLADTRGKVVVLDFWATWCGPCIQSFPAMRELVDHYAGSAVEIIGVTSLQGRVHGLEAEPIDCTGNAAKEHQLMTRFIEAKQVTWTVAFSREPVFNPAWGVRGIPFLAIVAPDGTVRYAGLHPSMPLAEKTRRIDALLEEFSLPRPEALN